MSRGFGSAGPMPVRVYKTIMGALYFERLRAAENVRQGHGGEPGKDDIERIDTATQWLQAMVTGHIEELSSIGPTPELMSAAFTRIADAVTAYTVMLESGMNQIRDVLERDYPVRADDAYRDYTPLQIAAAVQRAFDRTKNAKTEIRDALPPRYGGGFSLDEIASVLRSWRAEEVVYLAAFVRELGCSPDWNSAVDAVRALKKRNQELEERLAALKVPEA